MIWKIAIAEILKLTYPIIQAPMLGVSTPEMVAAVSNEGGLGSLPVGGLSPEITRQLIQKTKAFTNKPFAVNLFAHTIPEYNKTDIERMRQLLLKLASKRGYQLEEADMLDFKFYTYQDQIEILIQEKISIISFTFGCLDAASVKRFKESGCILIGTVTCVEEALILQEQGIDMIAVQGIEAGGHRGTFIDNIPLPQVGLFSLLPQVKNMVKIPCIAAGGINNGKTMRAAFELGADAVQIGTAFIGTTESLAVSSYKNKLAIANDTDTALTKAFTGRWARGIRNEMMNDIEQAGMPIPSYPFQNSLTTKLRRLAQQAGDAEYFNLWAGQSAGSINFQQTRDLFRNLVEQYEALNS